MLIKVMLLNGRVVGAGFIHFRVRLREINPKILSLLFFSELCHYGGKKSVIFAGFKNSLLNH